jgi:hypothetical protein
LAQEGAILVKLELPLRPFGWLEPRELDDGGHPSGNFGLQDMLAALSWAKQNVTVYVGDPGNVAAFGKSAGAPCNRPTHAFAPSRGSSRRPLWGMALVGIATMALLYTSIARLRNLQAWILNAADPYISIVTLDTLIWVQH